MEWRSPLLTEMVGEQFDEAVGEEWPADVALFVSESTRQSLLYEYAECLSARAFLRMCELPFVVQQRANAEFMSPSGEAPFIKVGKLIVADFEPIVDLVARKGIRLWEPLALSDAELADMQAHLALVRDSLLNAEMYVAWMHDETVAAVTRERYGSVFPWPLNWLLPRRKQRHVRRRLAAFGWADKSLAEVLAELDKSCRALSLRLGGKRFMCGERPTELDALVFGHLYTILTTELPNIDLAGIVRGHQNLVDFCQRVDKQYFMRKV